MSPNPEFSRRVAVGCDEMLGPLLVKASFDDPND